MDIYSPAPFLAGPLLIRVFFAIARESGEV